MASFSLIGEHDGRLVRITWTDGVFSGDPQLVAVAQSLAKAYDGKAFGPGFSPATYTAAEHIASPTSAYQLMQLCFLDQRPEVEGDVPELGYDDVSTWDGPEDGEPDGYRVVAEDAAYEPLTNEQQAHLDASVREALAAWKDISQSLATDAADGDVEAAEALLRGLRHELSAYGTIGGRQPTAEAIAWIEDDDTSAARAWHDMVHQDD